ncbi:MAG TPA: VOC family protein [Longimicrobiales bacterium]|nr:VOC family protein [Longimicrobiales bacterium]
MNRESYGIRPEGYRLPDETHVGAVVLQVSDLERSTAFYRDLLGFQELRSDAHRVQLGAGGAALVELRAGAKAPLQARRLGLYHFAILLPDRAALGRVLEHLVRHGIHPGASDHLVSEALYLSDPDGLGIEIYRDRPRGEWTATGRQVNMATEPLDFDAVLAEGGGVAWGGMPDGTTIGHVHLHVGDIDSARAFYHGALGFDVMVWNYPGALFLAAGGYHHHLGTNTWAGPQATAPQPQEPQLLQWQLVLPGAPALAEAADHIAGQNYAVTPEEIGGSIAQDPWGTAVHLVTG